NMALAYGLLGGALAGALGLAGGLSRRFVRAAMVAGLAGVVLGTATGAGASLLLTPEFYRRITPDTGMTLGMIIHAGVWTPIGAVSGLALGVGLGGTRAIALALLGGLAGAVLGTMGYEVASALLYPQARLDHPIPEERGLRLLAVFGIAV